MLAGRGIWRLLLESLRGSQVGREGNPVLGCPQTLAERALRSALGDRELQLAHTALSRAVVSWRPCSAHRPRKAVAHERVARLFSSLVTGLIALPNQARRREGDHLHRGDHQVSAPTLSERERQDVPGACAEGKAPSDFASISQLHFTEVRTDDLSRRLESARLAADAGTPLFVLPA